MQLNNSALALDGARHILSVLQDGSEKLEITLTNIATSDDLITRANIDIAVDMAWNLIDNSRRFLLFLPSLKIELSQSDKDFLDIVKQTRDSYHHIDERLHDFFSKNGESIFGKLVYRFRESVEQNKENLIILPTGIIRNVRQTETVFHRPELVSNIGIFDVRFSFVQKDFNRKTKATTYQTHEISIDELANVLNRIIQIFSGHILATAAITAMKQGITVKNLFYGERPVFAKFQENVDELI